MRRAFSRRSSPAVGRAAAMFSEVKSESKQYFQKLFMFSRAVLSVEYLPSGIHKTFEVGLLDIRHAMAIKAVPKRTGHQRELPPQFFVGGRCFVLLRRKEVPNRFQERFRGGQWWRFWLRLPRYNPNSNSEERLRQALVTRFGVLLNSWGGLVSWIGTDYVEGTGDPSSGDSRLFRILLRCLFAGGDVWLIMSLSIPNSISGAALVSLM